MGVLEQYQCSAGVYATAIGGNEKFATAEFQWRIMHDGLVQGRLPAEPTPERDLRHRDSSIAPRLATAHPAPTRIIPRAT
jgi:hypothetical protein